MNTYVITLEDVANFKQKLEVNIYDGPVLCQMDLLHTQLNALQSRLSWVQTDPIDWKLYVQSLSWAVCLFESYLLFVICFIIPGLWLLTFFLHDKLD